MPNILNITVQQVKDGYEGPGGISQSDTWIQRKIDQAVRLLLRNCPTIATRIALDSTDEKYVDPLFVADKVADAVLRLVRNPEGMLSETEGDYSYRLNPLVASGNLWYTRQDFTDLGCIDEFSNSVPRTVRSKASQPWGFPE